MHTSLAIYTPKLLTIHTQYSYGSGLPTSYTLVFINYILHSKIKITNRFVCCVLAGATSMECGATAAATRSEMRVDVAAAVGVLQHLLLEPVHVIL